MIHKAWLSYNNKRARISIHEGKRWRAPDVHTPTTTHAYMHVSVETPVTILTNCWAFRTGENCRFLLFHCGYSLTNKEFANNVIILSLNHCVPNMTLYLHIVILTFSKFVHVFFLLFLKNVIRSLDKDVGSHSFG